MEENPNVPTPSAISDLMTKLQQYDEKYEFELRDYAQNNSSLKFDVDFGNAGSIPKKAMIYLISGFWLFLF